MPPKRKRTEIVSESSASGSRGGGPSVSKSKAKTSKPSDKKMTAGRKPIAKQKAGKPSQRNTESEEDSEPPFKKGVGIASASGSATPLSEDAMNATDSIAAYTKNLSTPKARIEHLFATYADVDDPSTIGGEGLERLCTDGNIPMDGVQPLLLAWLVGASELGKLKKDKWSKALFFLRIDTLEKLNIALAEHEALLILKDPLQTPASNTHHSSEPYNRHGTYWHWAANPSRSFREFYKFVFTLAKAPQERNIDIEIAKAFWSTLLGKKYPLVNELVDFIDTKTKLKGVNKDLWAMTLDFCQSFGPTLEGYDADGAWPSLLDEFAAWKKDSCTDM